MAQLKIWDETSSSWVPAVVGARGDTGADSTVVGPQGVQGETGPAVDTSTLSVEQAQVTGLVAGLAGKAGLTGGNTFTGGQIINNTGGGRIFQAFSGGVLKVYVDGQGLFRLGTSASGSTGNFHIENGSAGYGSPAAVAMSIRGAAGQTANLQEWQTSAGTAVAKVDATGTLTAANFLQGTGSPLGVVSANPGAIYVDTASTMGASQWQKMSGTGTTGWVVTVGDTGWRAVGVTQVWRDAVIGAGMTLSDDNANGIILRRINQRVEIYYGINKSVAGGAVASGLIPDGWRPGASTGYIGTNSSLERLRFYVPSYGSPGSFGSQVALSVSMPLSYLTANAWPTVLPGTAA
jgi:hypothetical protein